MPEETVTDQPQAGSQDAGAEPETSHPDNSDLFGTSADTDTDASPTPESQSAEGESESEAETEGAEAGQAEAEQPESLEQDEFLASLSPEETAYYAKRYPTLFKAYQDPNQPADLRQAFIDRVNQDHEYAKLRDGQEEDGEPTSDETDQPAEQAQDPAKARQEYYAQIDNIVATQIDQQAVQEMGMNMLAAMGVDTKSDDPEVQALVKNAPKLGAVMAKGAIDLTATVLPNLLASRIDSVFPGFTRMYFRAMHGDVWDGVRNSARKGPDGQTSKPYLKLPAYGTPQFQVAIERAAAEFPGFDEMVFRDKNGQPLAAHEQAQRKYSILAKMMTGQKVDPAAVARAVETGKTIARKAQSTRAAGKALGAGKSNSQVTRKTTGNEDIFGDGAAEYQRQHGRI